MLTKTTVTGSVGGPPFPVRRKSSRWKWHYAGCLTFCEAPCSVEQVEMMYSVSVGICVRTDSYT